MYMYYSLFTGSDFLRLSKRSELTHVLKCLVSVSVAALLTEELESADTNKNSHVPRSPF